MLLYASRDWQGRATLDTRDKNGYPIEVYHSRDYTRDEWTALVERLTGTAQDRIDRENLRLSPAEQR